MKVIAIILMIVAGLLLLGGAFFRIMHLPGGMEMLFFGILMEFVAVPLMIIANKRAKKKV